MLLNIDESKLFSFQKNKTAGSYVFMHTEADEKGNLEGGDGMKTMPRGSLPKFV